MVAVGDSVLVDDNNGLIPVKVDHIDIHTSEGLFIAS